MVLVSNNGSSLTGLYVQTTNSKRPIGESVTTQNDNSSILKGFLKFLYVHTYNRTYVHTYIRTDENSKNENGETEKKRATRTQFGGKKCASKNAMLLFSVSNSIYNLLSKNEAKTRSSHKSRKMSIGLYVCTVVRLYVCTYKIGEIHV